MGQAALGRADLLRCLATCEKAHEDGLAAALGFTRLPDRPRSQMKGGRATPGSLDPDKFRAQGTVAPSRTLFYRVAEQHDLVPATVPEPPEPEEFPSQPQAAGPVPSLIREARLWPFLRLALGEDREQRQVDLPRVVDSIARGRPLRVLPRRRRRHWSHSVQIVFHRGIRQRPFWLDYRALRAYLERLRGKAGLQVLRMDEGPDGWCQQWRGDRDGWGPLQPYRLPEPGTPVLVGGDLGCLSGPDGTAPWVRFGQRLRRQGVLPVAMMTCPSRYWDPALRGLFFPICWDRSERFPRQLHGPVPWPSEPADPFDDPGAKRLLALLSAAVRVEPELLRALRCALPPGSADLGAEAAAWAHPDMARTAVAMLPDDQVVVQRQRAEFRTQPPEQQALALSFIEAYHAELPEAVVGEERLVRAELTGNWDTGARRFLEKVRQELDGADEDARQRMCSWVGRLGERQERTFWRHPETAGLWHTALGERLVMGTVRAPAGMGLAPAAWALPGAKKPRRWSLLQRGSELVMYPADAVPARLPWDAAGSPTASLILGYPFVQTAPDGVLVEARAGQTISLGASDLTLLTDHTEAVVVGEKRPPWAHTIGRDGNGLFVAFGEGEGERRARWWNPGRYPVRGRGGEVLGELALERGFFVDEAESLVWQEHGFRQPDWAARAGVDGYGLWAGLEVGGVAQRLRWIAPGEFLMGSPEDEPGRYDDESPRHPVVITRGYWLLDTPVTQALWEAVMGANPSEFQSPERPVESVSWNDAKDFIDKLNEQRPGLALRLPTEAEWEHACRAGTQTAVYTGDIEILGECNVPALDPIAWYGGNSGQDFELEEGVDSSDWPEKQYPHTRAGTHPVKGKQPNQWGLYDMLGNVWEWSADWLGNYPATPVVDPSGPERGEWRVLRGGSWNLYGRRVRSATRDHAVPGLRRDSAGFRLARGPELQQAGQAPAGGEPGRTDGAGREGRAPGGVGQARRGGKRK